MIDIRIHGRGGQGAVNASKILAWGFFLTGKYVQSFPFFGVERRGAPVYAYTRVSDTPIRLRCMIKEPDILLVLDPHLALLEDTYTGFKEGGVGVLNIPGFAATLPETALKGNIFAVDGTDIALRYSLGEPTAPIVNTVMTGAYAKATGHLTLAVIAEAIEKVLDKSHKRDVEAAKAAYSEVKRYELST